MLSTETQALGLQPERSGLHKIYRYGLYAYKRLRVHSPEKAHVFTPRSFIHVIANKTLGRVDPLVGRLRFFLQYPQGLKHYLRLLAHVSRPVALLFRLTCKDVLP